MVTKNVYNTSGTEASLGLNSFCQSHVTDLRRKGCLLVCACPLLSLTPPYHRGHWFLMGRLHSKALFLEKGSLKMSLGTFKATFHVQRVANSILLQWKNSSGVPSF